MLDSKAVGFGDTAAVAATGSSVGTTITATGAKAMRVVNTSATLYVCFRFGNGAQTAVLDTDPAIPPMGEVVVDISPSLTVTHVAAIGSAAGPTKVLFTPVFNSGPA